MKEKERYKIYKDNRENSYICDTSKNIDYKTYQEFIDLLNQQSRQIKELKQKNQQLKQQLHDLPKKIVEEIKEWIKSQIIYCGGKANEVDILIANASNQVLEDLQNILDTILKKYGGEENEKLRNVQND